MATKLLLEIDLLTDKAEDAIGALVFLANELIRNPIVQVRDDWENETGDAYLLRWRFEEQEDEAMAAKWIPPRRWKGDTRKA